MAEKKVRLLDVARYAGLGVGTASRVINNHPSVSEDKRRRVLQAIEELGYQCNGIARSLKAKKTKTIGVVIPDIANEYFSDVVDGIGEVAASEGYTILLGNSGSVTERELAILRTMGEKQVDGIVILSHTVADVLLDTIADSSLPAAFIATPVQREGFITVNINNEQAAFDALCHLIRLGHRHIGMVTGPIYDAEGGRAREAGYHRALGEHGIQAGPVLAGDYTYRSGYRSIQSLLAKPPLVTALFLASDYMAIGAIKALHDAGFSVPGDVSVVGFDNLAVSEYYLPALTTVNQPRFDMGKVGMRLLCERIAGKRIDESGILLAHSVLPRQSSAPPSSRK